MHKCPKCGTEFEGNFCPECGEKFVAEKKCPNCGKVLAGNTKFCNECGYSFYTSPQNSAGSQKPKAPARTHTKKWGAVIVNWLRFLPEALLALYGVLSFFFLIAPMTSAALIGSAIGNGYHAFSSSNLAPIRGWSIAILVFAVLALCAAVALFLIDRRFFKLLPSLVVSEAFFLVFLILSSALIAGIGKFDQGSGLVKAGACPVCFLVFSILFALFTAGGAVAVFLLKKKGAFRDLENKQRAAAEEKRKKKEDFYATHEPPVQPSPLAGKVAQVYYKYRKRNYDRGKEGYSKTLVWLDLHRIAVAIWGTILLLAILLPSILVPVLGNHFRIGYVNKLELGSSQERVVELFGEPDVKTDSVWEYHDKKLRSYEKKSDTLTLKLEEATLQMNLQKVEELTEEYQALQTKIDNGTYRCIEVAFSDGIVDSVFFDRAFHVSSYPSPDTQKTVKSCKLSSPCFYYKQADSSGAEKSVCDGTGYSLKFTDGSYLKAAVQGGAMSFTGSSATVQWTDRYSSHTVEVKEKNTVQIGYINKSGEWEKASSTKHCSIKNYKIPDGVTSIGYEAFYGFSKLKSIFIPATVRRISYGFQNCNKLKAVHIADLTAWCKIQFSDLDANPLYKAHHLYLQGEEVKELTIPYRVTSIGDYAFAGCRGLTGELNIPDSVTSIGGGAFDDCSGLTSLVIPNSVTSIGDYAFAGCSGLKGELTIPESIEMIIEGTFASCKGITSIVIPDSVYWIDENAFNGCFNLQQITIGNGMERISNYAFSFCDKLTDIHFNGEVQKWMEITKYYYWYPNSDFIVTCLDGTVKKDGTVTYFE